VAQVNAATLQRCKLHKLPLPQLLAPQVNLAVGPDQALELSDTAVAFLSRQFELHDSTGAGVLAITDLDRMFSTSPAPVYQVGSHCRCMLHACGSATTTRTACFNVQHCAVWCLSFAKCRLLTATNH
jgi:hypothetical protein